MSRCFPLILSIVSSGIAAGHPYCWGEMAESPRARPFGGAGCPEDYGGSVGRRCHSRTERRRSMPHSRRITGSVPLICLGVLALLVVGCATSPKVQVVQMGDDQLSCRE